jgi:LPS export ABC transporter permease LptG
MRILDRYVLKNFMAPFCYCFFGFIAIWLIVDLSQNGGDFIDAKASPWRVLYYYLTQVPGVIVICLPVAMLLSLLYSLSHMSRCNEIISMLTAGQSVTRVLLPLMGVGLLITAASMAFSYKLAPHAEAVKKVEFERLRGRYVETVLSAQLFRNRAENRTWYVQKMRKRSNELEGVDIHVEDADGNITRKYYARRAIYVPATGTWNLERGKTVNFDTEGNITGEELWLEGGRTLEHWSETPWRIASSNLDPQILSVPELRDYLRYNWDFPNALLAPYRTYLIYRWAMPWWCMIVVFIAAPLGIVYSRRGVLAGVASSIFIFFSAMFFDQLFLAMGKGARMSPGIAIWMPRVFFAIIGLFLLWLRSTNREMPKLRLNRRKS